MCNFKSFIVTKDGHILESRDGDSHEDIIEKYKNEYDLTDDTQDPKELKFARVEITPLNGDAFKPIKEWTFKIDQSITPTWFDKHLEKECFKQLKIVLSDVLIVGKKIDTLENKKGIWLKDCEIDTLKDCTINDVRGGTINAVWGGTINDVWGGTINDVRGGTINAVCGGTIVKIDDEGNYMIRNFNDKTITVSRKGKWKLIENKGV